MKCYAMHDCILLVESGYNVGNVDCFISYHIFYELYHSTSLYHNGNVFMKKLSVDKLQTLKYIYANINTALHGLFTVTNSTHFDLNQATNLQNKICTQYRNQ